MDLTTKEYEKIILEDIPLIDVRAPLEFQKGAFLNTINLPLMNDEERHLVGTCYKEKGHDEAVRLGHQLVSGKTKDNRVHAWVKQLQKNPQSYLYCFRGGLRSQITQEWIYESTGKQIPRLEGGFKAFRNYLLNELEPTNLTFTPLLLSGNTGTGKTNLLKKITSSIDLEGIANHRGSTFGGYITPQPTQIDFENHLAYEIIKHKQKRYNHLLLEDESIHIGTARIPKTLYEYLNQGNIILLEIPFRERVQNTLVEYVIEDQNHYLNHYGNDNGLNNWYHNMEYGIQKIQKRLGLERFKKVITLFKQAFDTQLKENTYDAHQSWIEFLLKEYYDPMYQYQINKRKDKIIFKGNSNEVLQYISELEQSNS